MSASYSRVSLLKVLAERYDCLFRLGLFSICDFDFVVENNEIQGSFGLTMWTLLLKNRIPLLVWVIFLHYLFCIPAAFGWEVGGIHPGRVAGSLHPRTI